jgi:hypothetical protein
MWPPQEDPPGGHHRNEKHDKTEHHAAAPPGVEPNSPGRAPLYGRRPRLMMPTASSAECSAGQNRQRQH